MNNKQIDLKRIENEKRNSSILDPFLFDKSQKK